MDPKAKLRVCVLALAISTVISLPEPGVWKDVPVPDDSPYLYFVKNMYKDTIISLEIHCDPEKEDTKLQVDWLLRHSPCSQEYHNIEGSKEELTAIDQYMQQPNIQLYKEYTYKTVQFLKFTGEVECSSGKTINLPVSHVTVDNHVIRQFQKFFNNFVNMGPI